MESVIFERKLRIADSDINTVSNSPDFTDENDYNALFKLKSANTLISYYEIKMMCKEIRNKVCPEIMNQFVLYRKIKSPVQKNL
jgi:hypothetical protein